MEIEPDQDVFFQNLMNTVCSQFFAVLASHPFHVLMVTSFSEFTCGKKSTLTQLTRSIFSDEGYFGFFSGLVSQNPSAGSFYDGILFKKRCGIQG